MGMTVVMFPNKYGQKPLPDQIIFKQISVRLTPPLVNSGAMKPLSLFSFLSWIPPKLCADFLDMETISAHCSETFLCSCFLGYGQHWSADTGIVKHTAV